jgi:hypothetical protein
MGMLPDSVLPLYLRINVRVTIFNLQKNRMSAHQSLLSIGGIQYDASCSLHNDGIQNNFSFVAFRLYLYFDHFI